MALIEKSCTHLQQVEINFPMDDKVCKECLEAGDTWVHLRMCVECGNIGCCDSSKNKHATKHFQQTTHPVMVSAQEGENWAWCYVDEKIKKLEI